MVVVDGVGDVDGINGKGGDGCREMGGDDGAATAAGGGCDCMRDRDNGDVDKPIVPGCVTVGGDGMVVMAG